jgi:hypothetical protein
MTFFIFKALLSGFLIAAISSVAKTSPKWAAMLTALPMMTILSLIWIYVETRDIHKLEHYTRDVFIWILPTLIFFVAALAFFKLRLQFEWVLSLSLLMMSVVVWLFEKMGWVK